MDVEIKLEPNVNDNGSRLLTTQNEAIKGYDKLLHDDKLSIKMELEPLDDEDLEYLAAAEAMGVQVDSPQDSSILTTAHDLLREHSYSKLSCAKREEIIYDSDPELQMVIEEEAREFSKLTSGNSHLSDSDDDGDKSYRNILQNMTTECEAHDQLVCKCLLCQRVWNDTEPFLRHLVDKHLSVPYIYVVEIDEILKITSITKMDKQYLNHLVVKECETTAVLYKCVKCFDLLPSYTNLSDHMKENHCEDISKYGKIDTHSCKSCHWEFISDEEYSLHGKDRKRQCPTCSIIVKSCVRLAEHVQRNRCVDLIYCPCGQMGKAANGMSNHALFCPLMPDTNDALYCPCGFFGGWEVIGKHFKTCQKYKESDICYICVLCSVGFFDLEKLSLHWSVKHQEGGTFKIGASKKKKSSSTYECVLCGALFPLSNDIISHVHLKHKKKASYPCMDCFTLFDTTQELGMHITKRKSLPDRYFVCRCGKALHQSCQLETLHSDCGGYRWQAPLPTHLQSKSKEVGTFNELDQKPVFNYDYTTRANAGSDYSKSFLSSTVWHSKVSTVSKNLDVSAKEKICISCEEPFGNQRALKKHMDVCKLHKERADRGEGRLPSGPPPRCAADAKTTRYICSIPKAKSKNSSRARVVNSGTEDPDSDEDDGLFIDDPSSSGSRKDTTQQDAVSLQSQLKTYSRNSRHDRGETVTISNNEKSTSQCNSYVEIDKIKPEISNLETEHDEIYSVCSSASSLCDGDVDIKTEIELKTEIDIKTEIDLTTVGLKSEDREIDFEPDVVLDVNIKEENQEKMCVEYESVDEEIGPFKFQCKGCKLGATTLKLYIQHFQNHGIKADQCLLCRKENVKSSMVNHLLLHVSSNYNIEWRHLQKHLTSTLEPTTYTCTFCDEVVSSDDLYHHWEDHYLPKMKNMVVRKIIEQPKQQQRKKTFIMKSDRRQHGSRTKILKDFGTSKTLIARPKTPDLLFLRPTGNLHHRKAPHCSTEAVALSTEDLLITLDRLVTKSKRPYDCHICHKVFNRLFDIKRHLVEHLVDDIVGSPEFNGVYSCQICQDKYVHVLQFKRHMRDHAQLTVYQCEICDKAFADSSNFSKHKKVHNIIYMQCDTCGRKFTSKKMLERHMEYHAYTKPVDCPHCERYFYFPSGLKKHVAYAHTKIRVRSGFTCQVCLARFDSMKNKWDHLWKDHNIRSVQADCPLCEDVGFRKKRDLLNHLKKEHPGGTYGSKPVSCGSQDPNQTIQEKKSRASTAVASAAADGSLLRPRILKQYMLRKGGPSFKRQ